MYFPLARFGNTIHDGCGAVEMRRKWSSDRTNALSQDRRPYRVGILANVARLFPLLRRWPCTGFEFTVTLVSHARHDGEQSVSLV